MPWSESIPQFSVTATILGIVLVAYASIGAPLLGRHAFARLERQRHAHSGALAGFYGMTIGIQVVWTAVTVLIVLLSPGMTFGQLGLRAPDAWTPLLAAVVGFCIALLVVWLLTRDRRPRGSERDGPGLGAPPDPGGHALATLAPRSRKDRRLAGALAAVASVGEELLYRGLFVALGVSLGLPLVVVAVLSCVLYALAHIYQGWWGLVGPGLLGALFMVLYLGTGSLFIPMVLHIILELRSLLLTGSGRRHRSPAL